MCWREGINVPIWLQVKWALSAAEEDKLELAFTSRMKRPQMYMIIADGTAFVGRRDSWSLKMADDWWNQRYACWDCRGAVLSKVSDGRGRALLYMSYCSMGMEVWIKRIICQHQVFVEFSKNCFAWNAAGHFIHQKGNLSRNRSFKKSAVLLGECAHVVFISILK